MISNDLLKGTLRTIVLKLLADHGRMYGYEITRKVEDLSAGKIKLTFGALYPVLHKLEADGHIRTETEYIGRRIRKYYSLTEAGRSRTQQKVDEFFEYVNTLTTLLKPTPAAEVLGISRRTLQELVAAREVACIKIGRSIRFSPQDLADFVERNRVKAIGWK